jgi:protoporphyrinogen oxidase/SAM-dependent methyltransferase
MLRVAIIGGGPGGLFAAHLLEQSCSDLCVVTVFEATSRLGGKVITRQFSTAPVLYEAGVAELYDYSHLGFDPLKLLVKRLGLRTVAMRGPAVAMNGAIVRNRREIRKYFGDATLEAIETFHRHCRELCCPNMYYEDHWQDDNQHCWTDKTFKEVLDLIPNDIARKYIEVAVRSDLATEPHMTSALNGLKNVLMDDSDYVRLYSIEGGIERLIDKLTQRIHSAVMLDHPVVRIDKSSDATYRLITCSSGRFEEHEFDYVIFALPNYWLERLEWGSRALRLAMQKHLAHYAHPAHYLRISVLFQQPFWRSEVSGSYFMMDAFGGCCVYDETARYRSSEAYGVLGWLLAGNDALALSNCDDERLVSLALDSLPSPLRHGRELFLEGCVHRWVGTISAQPGGHPTHGTRERHVPDPLGHAGLFVVGDYLFDSTINGVHDSADFSTDMLLTMLRKRKYAQAPIVILPAGEHEPKNGLPISNGHPCSKAHDVVPDEYHDLYDGERPYEESFREYFCERYTTDLIRAVWAWSPPYRLLDCGSANGLTLEAFAGVGVDAWGVENSKHIHGRTPAKWRSRNLLGDVRRLPFRDNSFDFVYDTCLCHVPEADLDQAIRELFRVCRIGIFYGGYTSDMTREVIEAYDIFEHTTSAFTLWEWSEIFMRNGFRVAASDPKILARAWRIETEANEGDSPWYPDAESMRYCFYSKPDLPPRAKSRRREITAR